MGEYSEPSSIFKTKFIAILEFLGQFGLGGFEAYPIRFLLDAFI
jgi:hypothetical protein